MKKFILALCLSTVSMPVFAEHIYDYQNTKPINDINSIQTKGCNEYVKIDPTKRFDPIEAISGRRSLTNGVLGGIVGGSLIAIVLDPYVIEIDGHKYVLVKDRQDKNWSEKDLLGIDDPKENRFASLIALNSDLNHGKLTPDELRKAEIRFVRLDSKGALLVNERNKDFNLDKIDYVDIINLKRTANAEVTGIFGHFTVYLKTNNPKKRAVVGYVTYETNQKIEYMFK